MYTIPCNMPLETAEYFFYRLIYVTEVNSNEDRNQNANNHCIKLLLKFYVQPKQTCNN